MKNIEIINRRVLFISVLVFTVICQSFTAFGQTPKETPPPPSKPTSVTLPEVKEMTLPNGLKVVVVQRNGLPLVTASLLVKSGSNSESSKEAGLAGMTAALLTKGTEFRSSTDIAEQIEFLGGNINSGASWDSSIMTINSMKSSLGIALSIMSDSVIRSTFPLSEVKLLKKQALDGFKVSLKQPGSLLTYVTGRYSFDEHAVTPQTIGRVSRAKIVAFHKENYRPANSVLIFTGDITEKTAFGFARLFFGGWQEPKFEIRKRITNDGEESITERSNLIVKRMLVIDLPNSGQAAVGYAKRLDNGRIICESEDTINNHCLSSAIYYPATVLNSVLGGGYSSRLNQEIRLKRGLSYGAGSRFSWRGWETNFSATTQTKNESAAEVAELIKTEIEKLVKTSIAAKEMKPRRAVVTGGFGRGLQTNNGLAARLRGLYLYNLNPKELNSYMNKVDSVSVEQIKKFASDSLTGGDIIIVGDSKVFMGDLQKRFPNRTIEIIKASDLDLNSSTLRKRGRRRRR